MTESAPSNVVKDESDAAAFAIRSRTGLPRVAIMLVVGSAGWTLPSIGTAQVLLPAKIAVLAPDEKVGMLALVSSAGAIVALVAIILFGAFSDLTRTRFGSRTPWIVGGGIVSGGLLFLASTAESIPLLLLWWCLFQAALNALITTLAVVIPDRVKPSRRGTISGIYNIGVLGGATVGSLIAAQFLSDPALGMRIFAIVIAVAPLIAVLIAPDFDNRDAPRPPMNAKSVLQSLALPPLRSSHDFYWALFGRLILVIGYYMVAGYQLYILTDFIGLDQAGAGAIISFGALLNLAGVLLGTAISGPVSDWIGRRKPPIFIASVFFAVAIVVPFIWPSSTSMLIYFAVAGFGFGIYGAVDAALMTEVLPSDTNRGKDLGILNAANSGGPIIAPIVSSALIGIGIGFPPVFIGAIAFCLVGAAAILPIRSVR